MAEPSAPPSSAWKRRLLPVDESVVGHHRLGRLETELGEEGEGPLERANVRVGVLAWMQLDVGDPRVVVDDAVQVVVADSTVQILGRAIAGDESRSAEPALRGSFSLNAANDPHHP